LDSLQVDNTKLSLMLGDITELDVDAVVNAANTRLAGGGGVDGAIHRAAGHGLDEECREIIAERGRLPTGDAVATTAGNMNARFIIHTVGPVYYGGSHGEAALLRSAYQSSLAVADSLELTSVAFPAISTGVFAYPSADAALVAVNAVIDYLGEHPDTLLEEVLFVLFDREAFTTYGRLFDQRQSGASE